MRLKSASLKPLTVLMVHLICISTFSFAFGQSFDDVNAQIIKDFSEALLDESIPPDKLVKKFIAYKAPSTNDPMLVQESYDMAVAHIKTVRRDKEGWFFPSYWSVSEYHVYPLSQYEELNTLFLSGVNEETKHRVYVLLDDEKEEIVQYFLMDSNKIQSFSLLIKGDIAYFFGYRRTE